MGGDFLTSIIPWRDLHLLDVLAQSRHSSRVNTWIQCPTRRVVCRSVPRPARANLSVTVRRIVGRMAKIGGGRHTSQ
jgi:hypothetical protein